LLRVDGTVESEVGLALARALGGQREGLLVWRDAVLAGVLLSRSVSDGLSLGCRNWFGLWQPSGSWTASEVTS